MTQAHFALGLGLGTQNRKGEWLDTFYAQPVLAPAAKMVDAILSVIEPVEGNTASAVTKDQMAQIAEALKAAGNKDQAELAVQLASGSQPLVVTLLATDDAPSSVPEGYLKLHLLSHRLVKPHSINLTGLFGALPNVAWTNKGAVDISELKSRQLDARLRGEMLEVMSVDKFPKMTNYVVPSGVRIAHTARVRLGAYLGEGTTIMHEGFVNFNAGTEGPGMIEGRISAGVMVGAGSDLGGGCSTMGTLSGGNNIIISVGKECLIGANAGVGIPLGDRCTIEAGLYITAGSVLTIIDADGAVAGTTKARELSGQSDLLFRRNSKNGAVEVLTNKSAIALNEMLHAHN
ncbi:MAG: 2,3,4,5-tetrahydropyridine-2-carboxylate N-succinyltransferase [Zhongshania aliphaticivorans]|jgi:2,3,4,5-tetrahydropyridine-2-carboxylate N-succinyltransferase|uniref:2,3,4,5-tetrahydropyridine-2,6-dicarboxylate N-succinyltransferase n=1 Tax=Zhongshania aliphaticivorans TaxID=1470434 RepID=A0A127M786_9GAMM|nr:2,3,4,5-tetrahydropyridine-2,6-dicarboxylate N-succinyltransferase [Zhongshania aliphaticivorans]AMO69076.1 2,3,4,5-tetrahydropyridine-2,6-dicarboxylate N-succinyltransferase [Zhongshania aliphaticivorans]EIF43658.1 2,3,4,5-tetrahydropyridine-2-carboxylate N-succinyltransferase [gamma proteobacterium BDW918]|tara:strand:+ start:22213 stop:23250 length:1038 start_codon:yes stop_codon:yes gene_type:complete